MLHDRAEVGPKNGPVSSTANFIEKKESKFRDKIKESPRKQVTRLLISFQIEPHQDPQG
jgi:hypothetical protein